VLAGSHALAVQTADVMTRRRANIIGDLIPAVIPEASLHTPAAPLYVWSAAIQSIHAPQQTQLVSSNVTTPYTTPYSNQICALAVAEQHANTVEDITAPYPQAYLAASAAAACSTLSLTHNVPSASTLKAQQLRTQLHCCTPCMQTLQTESTSGSCR